MPHPDYPQGQPAIRTTAMPADTNPAGDIFGGWLMSQMDLAAGNVAARRARGRCATVAVDSFTFTSRSVSATKSLFSLRSCAKAAARCISMSRPGAARARARTSSA